MRDSHGAPAPVDLSVHLYTWLLAAYPGRFRAEYGHHMAQVFRDVCRRDYHRGGLPAITSLWARTSLDLARTTVEEHIERGLDMNRDKFIRWSGWALVSGAIVFAAGLILSLATSDNSITRLEGFYEAGTYAGILLGEILFVIGLLGLRAGYAGRSGGLGAGLLAAAILGATLALIGFVALIARSSESFGWYAWSLGFLGLTVALAAYGVVAIQRRVFSRWNFAPLLAGVTALAMFAGFIGPETWVYESWIYRLALSITGVSLILIGYRMQADVGAIHASG